MRIALAQTNPTVGDIAGNAAGIIRMIARARAGGADCVLFPELALCGYPPRDLLLQGGFLKACTEAAKELGEKHSSGITVVFGTPLPVGGNADSPKGIANSLLAYRDGTMLDYYDKRLLPTYDIFDEDRYFTPGDRAIVIEVKGAGDERAIKVGLTICEDLWKGEDAGFASRYADAPDPVAQVVQAGARVILSASASPFVLGKSPRHRAILKRHAANHGVYVLSVNQVGGNDELIFDGHAAAYSPVGELIAAGPGFEEAMTFVDVPAKTGAVPDPVTSKSDEEQLFRALVLGVRDYCGKTGFGSVLLGLSGGIDSAVTAAIACAALGPANVLGVALPGPYSSEHSKSDAYELAKRLTMKCITVPIAPMFDGAVSTIDPAMGAVEASRLGEKLPDLAEENLQSRLRGTILMALSNRTGAIVLTTGNKSELAVGYCTLYGDMNGGLAVLCDLTKNWVYRLAKWMNEHAAECGFATAPIPLDSISKPPSAELRPDQKDQDSLPPYDVLDEILNRYVELRQSASEIIRQCAGREGFDEATVRRIVRLTDLSEYKRKQAAVGLKVTGVAFGSGRRMPIAQGWKSP
ncbi:MAG: NAD+ synthase [Phycisphaeraceae bacterium]|nr:NAD+ synthase [Phycisphaeraceae bacterium]